MAWKIINAKRKRRQKYPTLCEKMSKSRLFRKLYIFTYSFSGQLSLQFRGEMKLYFALIT